jgi:hypothetical protein
MSSKHRRHERGKRKKKGERKRRATSMAYLAEKCLSADIMQLAGHLPELVFVEDDALDGGHLVIRPLG